ncbi:Rgp1-domain-containing protein [Crucibulum laeve]|uniref:Rgp1-domain-containing protein n=1 Tax=Crucibulum laeve TaxID=68775 RepID=A0A5C3LZX9_9AGAR|nr:Rgp1-domain-containing protein [Crucibulum laeve]
MSGVAPNDGDSAIRVVVTPSQSSYFAGELFSVTITFTNTHSPEAGPSKPTSRTHKRGAHSISSAPLAQPPTSPGTPRTPIAVRSARVKNGDDVPPRKGLIGKPKPPTGAEQLPELIEQRRKRLLAKSLSVTIAPHELEGQMAEGTLAKSASFAQPAFEDVRSSPTSPHVPSPLARRQALTLASDHPHARKQSVLDGQYSLDVLSPTTSGPSVFYSPSSSTSTFSLALDPIAEGTLSPYASTPSILSPTIETPPTSTFGPSAPASNSVYAYPPPAPRSEARRPLQIGLGHPPRGLTPPKTAFSSTFSQPNAELILYSYAQLMGTVTISAIPGALATPEQTSTLNAVRAALLKRSAIGGGSMDITSSLHQPPASAQPRPRPTHSRSSSFSSGIMSLLSPNSAPASAKWRSASSLTSPASGKFLGSAGLPLPDVEIDPETPLPTFEVQPAMLAVDLALLPGESRSYTYTLPLPDNLPPTFKGKSLKLSYELVVGTCRAGSSNGTAPAGTNSISRVMKVPIRVYNHVSVGRPSRPYDLLWPVSKTKDRATVDLQGKVVEDVGKPKERNMHVTTPQASTWTYDEVKEYAQQLLASLPDPEATGVRIKLPAESVASSVHENGNTNGNGNGNGNASNSEEAEWRRAAQEARRKEKEREREEEGGLTGCREAVEILTRNPKKASYDVNKDGVKVAVLTFTKAAYRLGETVCGVVELNERSSRARVLKLSAILEAHETLPSTISPPSSSRHLRRAHAEYYSSLTLSAQRIVFSLDIPSDASPAFQLNCLNDSPFPPSPLSPSHPASPAKPAPASPGGLEWKVRLCLLVAIAAESSSPGTEGVRFKSLVRDGPRGEWGSSFHAPSSIAPLEKPHIEAPPKAQTGWASFFSGGFLGGGEREYHDGDDLDGGEEDGEGQVGYDGIKSDPAGGVGVGVDYTGGDEGWHPVKVETVECEVPIRVWPGNTAFKAMDVVFDV